MTLRDILGIIKKYFIVFYQKYPVVKMVHNRVFVFIICYILKQRL